MTFFADQSRHELRAAYREAWRKARERLPMQPLEAQIADVIQAHPEYHALIDNETSLQQDYTPESGRENPFLHMGLHLAIHEQVSTDRPAGIAAIHRHLATRMKSEHEAEHRMIDVLGFVLWESQRSGRPAADADYLERLRKL